MAEVVRVVSLWIHSGQEEAFEAFEREAAEIMAGHGGRIDRAVRIGSREGESPYEVHIVTFPDDSAVDSYRADAKTQRLAQRRSGIIAKTITLAGEFCWPVLGLCVQ